MEREEDKIKRVAQMLENASNILRGTESTENSRMQQTSGFNTHALSSNTTQVSSSNVRRALDHARNDLEQLRMVIGALYTQPLNYGTISLKRSNKQKQYLFSKPD